MFQRCSLVSAIFTALATSMVRRRKSIRQQDGSMSRVAYSPMLSSGFHFRASYAGVYFAICCVIGCNQGGGGGDITLPDTSLAEAERSYRSSIKVVADGTADFVVQDLRGHDLGDFLIDGSTGTSVNAVDRDFETRFLDREFHFDTIQVQVFDRSCSALASIPGMEGTFNAAHNHYQEDQIKFKLYLREIELERARNPDALIDGLGEEAKKYNELVYGIYTALVDATFEVKNRTDDSVALSADFRYDAISLSGDVKEVTGSDTQYSLVLTSTKRVVIGYLIKRYQPKYRLNFQLCGADLLGSFVDLWVDGTLALDRIYLVEGELRDVGEFPRKEVTQLRAVVREYQSDAAGREYTQTANTLLEPEYTWQPGCTPGSGTSETNHIIVQNSTSSYSIVELYLKPCSSSNAGGNWIQKPIGPGESWDSGHLPDGNYELIAIWNDGWRSSYTERFGVCLNLASGETYTWQFTG